MRRALERPLLVHGLCALTLVLCTLLAYANSFDATFLYDDFHNFADNPRVHWYELRLEHILEGILGGPTQRPVAIFSFGLNFFFGGREVTGYHVFNFVVHAANSIAVYALILATMQLANPSRREPAPESRGRWIVAALLAALVFALHPLQTQAVTYVVQRMTSMATGFYLAAFLLYVHGVRTTHGIRRWLGWGGLGLLYLLGLGSKEIAAPLPIALWLYEWLFGQQLDVRWAKRNAAWLIPPLASYVAGFAFLYEPLQAEFANRDFSMSERMLTQLRVVFFYASLVLAPLPSRQNLLHLTPTSHSLFDPATTALSLLGLLAVLGFACWLAPRRPLSAFGMVWFFLHLAVESSVLPLEMIYEHRIYLPMFGFSLIVADVLLAVPRARSNDAFALAATVVFALGCLTYTRNELWRDPAAVWADVYAKTGDARARQSVAWAIELRGQRLAVQGRDRDALVHFRQAAQVAPEYAHNYRSWGDALTRLGRMKAAAGRFQKAIELAPDRWASHEGLTFALMYLERVPEAILAYKEMLQLAPSLDDGLGAPRRLFERNEGNKAILLLEAGVAARPDATVLRRELANIQLQVGYFELASAHFRLLLAQEPSAELHGKLALALWELGDTAAALQQIETAGRLEPDDTRHTANLAWMLATAPEPGLRDPGRALELIEPLIADPGGDTDWLDTSAAALAALGRWDEALARIERALELARSLDSPGVAALEQRRQALQARETVIHGIDR